MKRYLVIYHMPDELLAQTQNASPEEAAEGMKQWHMWAEKCGSHMIDMGTPLMGGLKLKPKHQSEPSSRQVVGYSLIEASDMEQAKSLLQDHPHLGWSGACEIEVHESMPLPG